MSLKAEWIRYGSDNEYSGFLVWQERAALPLPAVVVIQEAWGVDPHIEDVTRRIAQAGYVAFAPDLYAKDGERPPPLTRERIAEAVAFINQLSPAERMDAKAREVELTKRPIVEADRIGETMTALFAGGYLPPLIAAASFLRTDHPATRGQRIAAVGFCMGGGLAALLACNDPELAGAVVFYGRCPPLDMVPKIRCPILGFYGSLDKPINDGVPAFAAEMWKHDRGFEQVMYEGVQHAFFNDVRPTYDVRAARDAYARTLDFLRRTLV